MLFSDVHASVTNGSDEMRTLKIAFVAGYTTDTDESCDTNARTSPEGENDTPCTHPPAGEAYSPHTVLNGSLLPHTDGAGFSSTSLMYAENTRAFISALPAASSTLFGCQSTESTVERIGFLSCLATHQLFSASNEQIAIALAPEATANLSSFGLQRTNVAARDQQVIANRSLSVSLASNMFAAPR